MLPFLILLFSLPLWAGDSLPEIGGDVPLGCISDSIIHEPIIRQAAEQTTGVAQSVPPVADSWSKFTGRFQIGVEQSPIQYFSRLEKKQIQHNVATNNGDDEADSIELVGQPQYRSDWIFSFTPLEAFGQPDGTNDPSTSRQLYSFHVGFGFPEHVFVNLEERIQIPISRWNNSQFLVGGYLDQTFFRNGYPYHSAGVQASAAYLIPDACLVQVGVKRAMWDYSQEKTEEFFIQERNLRMFVNLSFSWK